MTEYVETPEETIHSLRERIQELEADRSIKHNGARKLASYVIHHLTSPNHHGDDELLNTAYAIVRNDIPATTPWLIQMMEVARKDINGLPQQVFQLKEDINILTQHCTELENELQILKDTMYDAGVERGLRT